MTRQQRYKAVLDYFRQHHPEAATELHYDSPFALLVAVVLSAQCTDKRVNLVTPALLAAYPTPQRMAEATEEAIFAYIHSVSYPHNKARHLLTAAQRMVQYFNGQVPTGYDDLLSLPGVGRKTANVLTSVLWNEPRMAVDTHVFRVANRLGLTHNSRTPLETEKTLTKNIPAADIPIAHHWLILHGRYVCTARAPHCATCPLSPFCQYFASHQRIS